MSWNMKLIAFAAVIVAACTYRLYLTAAETGNFHGANISLLHLVVVALGVVVALWQQEEPA
jgi:hypothetical protein